MSQVKFLIDADVAIDLAEEIRKTEPAVDFLALGETGAPPTNIKDPALLLAAESMQRFLISRDKKTMPRHLQAHFAGGHHTWGLLLLRKKWFSWKSLMEQIVLIWGASEAEEWTDVVFYFPDD